MKKFHAGNGAVLEEWPHNYGINLFIGFGFICMVNLEMFLIPKDETTNSPTPRQHSLPYSAPLPS
jgi:hypothetical protein